MSSLYADRQFIGGMASTTGSGADAGALSGMNAGNATDVTLRENTVGNMLVKGGKQFDADAGASAAILAVGEVSINGPLGLEVRGAGDRVSNQVLSGAVGSPDTLFQIAGRGHPITIVGNISLVSDPTLSDAFFVSGAPLLNLDRLLSDFLKSTDCVTFAGGSCTIPGTGPAKTAAEARDKAGLGGCK